MFYIVIILSTFFVIKLLTPPDYVAYTCSIAELLRIIWLIPLLFIWVVYLGIRVWMLTN